MLKAMMNKINARRLVGGLFPIVQWSKSYDVETAIGDLIAGITVALTLIPQAIAYASLAGFEPQYGLYASLVGGFVYGVMGTCPQINIGPTALLSLLTFTYTHETGKDFAVLLCFISGIVQLIAGVARLGFLVEFVSLPVVSGFTSAAALTIASSQIKGLLGLRFNAETFVATWSGVFEHIGDTRLSDTLLGLSCCIILMGMKALKDIPVKADPDESGGRGVYLKKTCWFTAVSRNAVVVVGAAILAYFIHRNRNEPLILTGNITPGLPIPQVPPFTTTVGNTTYTAGDMFAHLGTGLLVVPLVGIISNIAIAKAFSTGKALDATQEIVALGACNVVSAFFTSYPVNGSFSRSAVSDASGVKTPAAGFYTGVIVLLTLVLLTPYFYFIPRSALAAVIVCAVLNMVDVAILKKLWATSRLDIVPLMGTFILCLGLGVEIGLICGVGIDAILLLYYHSRPPLDVKYVDDGNLPPHYVLYPVGGLHFAGAEAVRTKLLELRNPKKINTPIIVLETLTIRPDSDNLTNVNVNSNNGRNENDSLEMNQRRESDNRVVNQEGSVNIGINGNITGSITDNVRVESAGRKSANILVINCSALHRMDYTFLQSVKMLVLEWSRSGHVIWCDIKPAMREQLDSVLHNPLYCESEHLNSYLTRLTFTHEPQPHVARDTHL